MEPPVNQEVLTRIREHHRRVRVLLDEVSACLSLGDARSGQALVETRLRPLLREQASLMEAVIDVLVPERDPDDAPEVSR